MKENEDRKKEHEDTKKVMAEMVKELAEIKRRMEAENQQSMPDKVNDVVNDMRGNLYRFITGRGEQE